MSAMKCTIPGVSLKVFGRAIQSLSKIGDELYFEPLEDGLFLRSVNSCRSAYSCFQFSPTFFVHYVVGSSDDSKNSNEEDVSRCKVGMKSIMAVFKNLSTIDKTVEKCKISLNMSEARLVFQMYCRHGIIKTHNLAFIECETLQAVFSKDLCPNKLTAPPKLLCDAVLNFQASQEEITLIVRPDFMALKNYVEDEPDPTKVVHTELTLSPDEFDHYQVGVDTDITFCLKEFRAILAFSDLTGLPLTLNFQAAGRPITFSIDSDLSFEANFVLATLADSESSQGHSSQAQQQTTTAGAHARKGNLKKKSSTKTSQYQASRDSSQPNTINNKNDRSSTNTIQQRPYNYNSTGHKKAACSSNMDEEMNDDDDEELTMSTMMDIVMDHSVTAAINSHHSNPLPGPSNKDTSTTQRNSESRDGVSDNGDSGDIRHRMEKKGKNSACVNQFPALTLQTTEKGLRKESNIAEDLIDGQHSENELSQSRGREHISNNLPGHVPSLTGDNPISRKHLSLKHSSTNDLDSSPVIPVQDASMLNQSTVDDVEEDEDDEEIPATPPSKKFRSVFFGTQSSTQPSQTQQNSVILAPDSDEDD